MLTVGLKLKREDEYKPEREFGALVIEACFMTPFARDWLERSTAVRVLHVFDHACNLVDDAGEIVSLVTAEVGRGPFAIVTPLPAAQTFSQFVTLATPVTITGSTVRLGALVVDTASAIAWSPRPAWEQLSRQTAVLFSDLSAIKRLMIAYKLVDDTFTTAYRRQVAAGADILLQAIQAHNVDGCREGVRKLAGLGVGLTPSGDDFLIGFIYGLWATRSLEEAQLWGKIVAETAAPQTTLLSAAWLRAAARGEANESWHDLVRACGQRAVGSKVYEEVVTAVERISSTGHTSGTDALAGFTAVLELGI